jgi:tetratricopeptide (TPR) repeat protein
MKIIAFVLAISATALLAQRSPSSTTQATQQQQQQTPTLRTGQDATTPAQQPSNTQPNAQQQTGAQQSQAAPEANAGPRPKSQAELDALKALIPELQNPASAQPAKVEADIQNFITKFPQSEYKEAVYTLGMDFFRAHNDYLKTLEYGEIVLKMNPDSLPALLSLGGSIPQRVKETDLDRDERLAQAEGYDKRAEAIANKGTYNGRPLTPDQLQMVRAGVHSSLALIAFDRKQFQQAVTEYQQAIPLDQPSNAAVDYYRLAQAQEELKQFDAALASLDKAQQLGGSNQMLASVIGVERQKIAKATGKPVAAPAPNTSQPSTAQPSAAVPHP